MPLKEGIKLYFLRHGQTEWNRLKRLQGQIDIPLNDTGRSQAAGNGQLLRSKLGSALDTLSFVSSPLLRTRETMEIAREAAGLTREPYDLEPLLKEINYGHWEGAYLDQLKRDDPEGYEQRRTDKFHWQPVGGESYAQLQERVGQWLSTVTHDLVVVSHGGVSRVLRGLVSRDLSQDDIPNLEVPQDRVMVVTSGGHTWL